MSDTVQGILALRSRHEGVLRDPSRSFRPDAQDVRVPSRLIQAHRLPEGAELRGPVRRTRRGAELQRVESICGLSPEAFAGRTPLERLTAVSPTERFQLAQSGDLSTRIVDLIAPIGRGARVLIVSPPKAGKTMLLMSIARALRSADPAARIIALLIDERPEEVTYFRRSADVEVLASSKDHSPAEHVALTEITLGHVRAQLECGRDVILLVDSLTRMARAFNVGTQSSGRTMSGGIEAGVLEVPRRLLGLARQIEGGGSVTIVATVLVDTGSRMDELIFQEFKGTGNSEIVLDRSLAEARVFPAIDLLRSGTRREELLLEPDEAARVATLRRVLGGRRPLAAMRSLLKTLEPHPTNESFLASIPLVRKST
ncbi:MAG: transcription termination factor Rho [Candidatus Eisenbacteria bacterium]|nr:transcription termination factor Rho [Candidatus Eisenbacteria bacterium]